ncbi:NADH-quinone oxidoreductase subunit L [Pseudovibrio sp. Tun.PSC04-5.I4]|uniref:NADH-quinone oxidoreductase subunit L n=1 Tax=Pseudovibrio sp. Tun.PSC04-5.I4 TaxID=1798213 RepID=UPI00088806AA|nr:NADH-quinone oxidoreductase subunit L [Pseudovibrio sp. Tun.PSC04-5.I4]SDR08445.1 NADH dehydrogenase subunit L [Pseudovibrio sp. Tun.PSC04-5.I4]
MFSAIVFLPLLGFLIVGLFGNRLGVKASEYITSGFMIVAALLSWVVFFQFGLGSETTRIEPIFRWITSGDLSVSWTIRVDTLTAVMLVVVNSVSCLVHIYSIGYMHHDPHRPRFFAYLSFFTFSMLALVTSDDLLQMFFGWEGVGLASYLLIGFWYKKPSANAAAMKAFIVNRVGDFGFALGIFGVFYLYGSIDFTSIFSSGDVFIQGTEPVLNFLGYDLMPEAALTVVCLLLFMGAMGKSAQFLLHTWLPDAMEGPTPVSALIHAATMVTAGVFMVARLAPIFELAPNALTVVTFVGATTAFFAATIGCVQNDIKRVIAYSTCSQLGYMFVALGVGAYGVAIFHLFTHAFFKALLFLCAGSVIHSVSDEQDMRKMGGLRKHIPVTYWTMMIGTLALTGFGIPFTYIGTAGFISKDAIIEAAYVSQNMFAGYAFWATVLAAALTSFYSWRLVFMTFHGKTRASVDVIKHIHESPWVMLVPLLLLALGAAFAGMVFKEAFIGADYLSFWKNVFGGTSGELEVIAEMHHVHWLVKLSPWLAMAGGFLLAYLFYVAKPDMPKKLAERHKPVYLFLLNKWYFDELYDFLFVKPSLALGRFLWKRGDGTVIDGFGPDGVAARVQQVTGWVVRLQSGYIYHYAFAMLIGVAFFVTLAMFSGGGVH